jgi:hypothetical protein
MRQIILIIAVILSYSSVVMAQNYERFPSYSFQISAIEWNLAIEPTMDGFTATATYHLRSNRDGVQTIAFAQRDLLIESVKLGDDELPFIVSTDSIRISLRDPVNRGSDFKISVEYGAYPTFGFFIDPSVLVWTSGLHGVVPGLLPIIDHPRVRYRLDVTITHPTAIQVVANGGYVSRTVLNVSEARTVFRSRTPISASSMRLAFGMMQSSEVRVGSIPVRMYVGDNTRVADGGRTLLSIASTEIQRMSSQLKNPFPYEGMNFLVVPSSYGETWGDGAGFAVVFDDLGDLENQVKIAVASQWLRQSLQSASPELQYAMASYTRQLARLDKPELESKVAVLSGLDAQTDMASILVHTASGYSIDAYPHSDLEAIMRYIPGLIWMHDIEEIRFSSGWAVNPLPATPTFRTLEQSEGKSSTTGGFYLRFERTENPEIISLVIDPYGQPATGEYVMDLREVYLNDTFSQSVRFSESGGEIKLDVDNGLLNIIPLLQDGVSLRVDKPLGYWLHQFRNSVDRGDKIDAARALGAFAGDQDLGLLIRDLERNELDPTVKASITLGMMESGVIEMAPSTVTGLLEVADQDARLAVLALVERQSNPVLNAEYLLAMFSKPTTSSAERRLIAKMLSKLMPPDEFDAFIEAESKKPEGRELMSVLLISYFEEGSLDAGIEMADLLIGREYAFVVRRDALTLLDKYDTNSQRWSARLPRLASDQDPRIRVMALDRVTKLDNQQSAILIQDRSAKEADPRIQARIRMFRR